ncbi:hypothetical protein MUY27_17115 [Mucilaginibacter sp. RS28]|uniref:Uncharacterized protein n=1 Tax=Mucilaginibacter straminoryzae TaxID=2932774 RepID=A0A9X2BCW6_9SPHI|nr:hypothetical protein [Mucilaginibacter straminoryzae]MCJ8211442.1 hypothetical protein [Mucilaginibacter straminoryzae]
MDEELKIKILDKSVIYRGTIIDIAITLEKSIERSIIRYITPDFPTQVKIINQLSDFLSFESKRASLKSICDQQCIEKGISKTNTKGYPHSKLFNEIAELMKVRNVFAHYLTLTFGEAQVRFPEIGFIHFKFATDVKWYNDNSISDLVKRFKDAIVEIDALSSFDGKQ